jgi:hypothetical protein
MFTLSLRYRLVVLGVSMASTFHAGCGSASETRRVVPSYDIFTGELMSLAADLNSDGSLDQWTYLSAGRPVRGEADVDGDGRIDRWEYFDSQAQLVRVGSSSRADGIEDRWTWVATNDGEGRIDVSLHRDRHIDRHEFFRDQNMVRSENDSNGDGRIDRWDRYEGGVLREAAFDTGLTTGRADRRLLYDARGRYLATEADLDGDGRFERVLQTPAAVPNGGK